MLPSVDSPNSEPAITPLAPTPVVETRPIAVPVTSAPLGKPGRATGSIRMLAVLAFLGACWWASDLLVPVMLALFLALIANPMVKRLQKVWLPRWLGALVVVLGGLTATVFVASLLIGPASDWVARAPTELRQLAPKIRSLTLRVDQANKAAESIAKAAGAATTAVVTAADKPHAPNLWGLISSTPRMLASILAIVLLSYFFLVFGVKLQQQAMAQMPSSRKKRITADILSTIESDLSTYVLTITAINVVLGLLLTGALWWMGLQPSEALLWGTVATLLNFIPYVGPLTGVAALALVGVVAFDHPGQMLLPPALYLCLHLTESQFVTPIVLGRRMAISPLIMLLWLMLWGWLWGIAGLLLAVPMLTSGKIIAERIDGWQGWAKVIE